MRRSRLITLAVLGSILPILAARAQTADSTTFRAGQWGAEFSLGSGLNNVTGASALRFHSPRRASVFNVNGQVSRQSGDAPGTQSQTSVGVGLGTRWYRSLSRSVLQSFTLGVLASRNHSEQRGFSAIQAPTPVTRTTSTGGGVFAELGGTWMVTSQLSLGAAWQGNAMYSRLTRTTVDGDAPVRDLDVESTVWNAAVGGLVLRLGVYF